MSSEKEKHFQSGQQTTPVTVLNKDIIRLKATIIKWWNKTMSWKSTQKPELNQEVAIEAKSRRGMISLKSPPQNAAATKPYKQSNTLIKRERDPHREGFSTLPKGEEGDYRRWKQRQLDVDAKLRVWRKRKGRDITAVVLIGHTQNNHIFLLHHSLVVEKKGRSVNLVSYLFLSS